MTDTTGGGGASGPGRDRTAARDAVEMELCAIWAAASGRDRVGVRDAFPSAPQGEAEALLLRVNEHFGLALDTADLRMAGTVERLAELVRGSRANTLRSLVLLRDGGDLPPLFCFHPLPGTVFKYAGLGPHLRPGRRLYGLESRGLQPESEPCTDLPKMVAAYLDEIRRVQRDGPYALFGYSLGGHLAFEAAQQLIASGAEVSLLCIGDQKAEDLPAGWVPDAVTLFGRLRLGLGLDFDVSRLMSLGAEERIAEILRLGLATGSLPPGFSVAKVRRMLQMYEYNGAALEAYRPEPVDSDITLIRADHPGEALDKGWRKFSRGRVTVHTLACDHFRLLDSPFAAQIAGIIEDRLADGGPDLR